MMILLLISLSLLLIGLVSPTFSLFWSTQSKTKQKSLLTYCILSVAFFICFGIATDWQKEQNLLGNLEIKSIDTPFVDINDTAVSNHLFKYPEILIQELSKNGIGELKPWNNRMDIGWGSLTDYYSFGTMGKTGLQNNLAYYVMGEQKTVNKINITLNLNQPKEKNMALKKMASLAERTFETLRHSIPTTMKKTIESGKPYKQNMKGYSVIFAREQSKIETFSLEIVSK